jgi:chromosome segregation ATPase
MSGPDGVGKGGGPVDFIRSLFSPKTQKPKAKAGDRTGDLGSATLGRHEPTDPSPIRKGTRPAESEKGRLLRAKEATGRFFTEKIPGWVRGKEPPMVEGARQKVADQKRELETLKTNYKARKRELAACRVRLKAGEEYLEQSMPKMENHITELEARIKNKKQDLETAEINLSIEQKVAKRMAPENNQRFKQLTKMKQSNLKILQEAASIEGRLEKGDPLQTANLQQRVKNFHDADERFQTAHSLLSMSFGNTDREVKTKQFEYAMAKQQRNNTLMAFSNEDLAGLVALNEKADTSSNLLERSSQSLERSKLLKEAAQKDVKKFQKELEKSFKGITKDSEAYSHLEPEQRSTFDRLNSKLTMAKGQVESETRNIATYEAEKQQYQSEFDALVGTPPQTKAPSDPFEFEL